MNKIIITIKTKSTIFISKPICCECCSINNPMIPVPAFIIGISVKRIICHQTVRIRNCVNGLIMNGHIQLYAFPGTNGYVCSMQVEIDQVDVGGIPENITGIIFNLH